METPSFTKLDDTKLVKAQTYTSRPEPKAFKSI